jgi:hypothetical protein
MTQGTLAEQAAEHAKIFLVLAVCKARMLCAFALELSVAMPVRKFVLSSKIERT